MNPDEDSQFMNWLRQQKYLQQQGTMLSVQPPPDLSASLRPAVRKLKVTGKTLPFTYNREQDTGVEQASLLPNRSPMYSEQRYFLG